MKKFGTLLVLWSIPATIALSALSCSARQSGPTFNFVEATIEDVQEAIHSGSQSCTDIIGGYLERIDHYDQSSGLNAIIFTNPNALSKAAEIDPRVAAGEELGPLFCAPVLLKDNYDTADMPTMMSVHDWLPECIAS